MERYDLLSPDLVCDRVTDIDFARQKDEGYSFIILDVDNTISECGSVEIPDDILLHLRINSSNGNISGVCLISNIGIKIRKRAERIVNFAQQIGTDYILAYWPHLKPNPEPFRNAMQKMGSMADNTIVIGDQLFTDIKGGNLLGLRTIWIQSPLGPDHPITYFNRFKERRIAKRFGFGAS